jgi:signal transduction histidine kinase
VDAGQRLARQTLALDELVLEVYHQERPLAEGVRLEIGAWDRAEVVGDADRLKQVLLNLVDNALRYTPTGGTVRIEVARNADAAVVRVRDTGPGIPDAERERIFERFYRVDQGRSRGDGGTGLGLAIAREVAEAHGGRIEVESKPGRGSTFSLIPAAGAGGRRGTGGDRETADAAVRPGRIQPEPVVNDGPPPPAAPTGWRL